ncbi:MAG TPA: 30S ribosomal protein S3 [Anaerolineae bacterium]
MGRKIHPYGFRLGVIKDWQSLWYSADKKVYNLQLSEDIAIRKLIRDAVSHAGISQIRIQRFPNQVSIDIFTAKPGIIIGRKGETVNKLRKSLEGLTKKKIKLEVLEAEKPEMDAALVADSIAQQIERRISHKRAMKQAMTRAMRAGAKGIKIKVGGRLSGSEMKRRESVMDGRVPLNTLRADIDFARTEAHTTYGRIGVKVWVYRGEVLPDQRKAQMEQLVGRALEQEGN